MTVAVPSRRQAIAKRIGMKAKAPDVYKARQLAGRVDGIWREFDLDLDTDEDIELVECSCNDDVCCRFLRKKGLSVHTPLRELSILISQSLRPKSHAPKPERPRPPTKPKCRVQVEHPRPRNARWTVTFRPPHQRRWLRSSRFY